MPLNPGCSGGKQEKRFCFDGLLSACDMVSVQFDYLQKGWKSREGLGIQGGEGGGGRTRNERWYL